MPEKRMSHEADATSEKDEICWVTEESGGSPISKNFDLKTHRKMGTCTQILKE